MDTMSLNDLYFEHKSDMGIFFLDAEKTLLYCVETIRNGEKIYYSPIGSIDHNIPEYENYYDYMCCSELKDITIWQNEKYFNNSYVTDKNFTTGYFVESGNSSQQEFYFSFEYSGFYNSILITNGYGHPKYAKIKLMQYHINNELAGMIQLEDTDNLQEIIFKIKNIDKCTLKLKIMETYPNKKDSLVINEIILMENEY
jgi:hypothetical protein